MGPWEGHALAEERLPGRVRPSNWYLTGFLIPSGTPPERSADADEADDMEEEIPESAGLAEESNDERKAAKKAYFPASMGLSFLVPKETTTVTVTARWGDYTRIDIAGSEGKPVSVWQRHPRVSNVLVSLKGSDAPVVHDFPDSGGLQLHVLERLISARDLEDQIPQGTRSVSVFLVNSRTPVLPEDGEPDLAYAFQPELEVKADRPFVPRPDLRGVQAAEWDEQVADLHYADTPEYATGHGVSAEWDIVNALCYLLRTAWIPSAEVEKTATAEVSGVELSMDKLAALADGAAVDAALRPLFAQYSSWIESQRVTIATLKGSRREAATELLRFAGLAAERIQRGITILAQDADALDAFRVANRAVARALRKRLKIEAPRWRAFQVAFILAQSAGPRRPVYASPRDGRLALFPNWWRKDRGVSWPCGICDGAPTAASRG